MWPTHRSTWDEEPAPARAAATPPTTPRSVLVWFTSPRQAVRVLFGLNRLAPAVHLRLGVSEATGAEGPVIVASGRVPADDQVRLQRAFDVLEVAAMWDAPNQGEGSTVRLGADPA